MLYAFTPEYVSVYAASTSSQLHVTGWHILPKQIYHVNINQSLGKGQVQVKLIYLDHIKDGIGGSEHMYYYTYYNVN